MYLHILLNKTIRPIMVACDISMCFSGNTEVAHDKIRGQLVVNATIPKDGEYAVVITALDKKDKAQKKAKPVVGYLVTTQIDDGDSKI